MSNKKGGTLPGGQSFPEALQCIKQDIERIELKRKNMRPIQFAKDVDNMLRLAKGKLNTLEQLELKNVQSSSILDLQKNVKSIARQVDELQRQEARKARVMEDINKRNFDFRQPKPMSGLKNNVRYLRRGIIGRIERFQDRLGDMVGYFFVFFFGYQSWGQAFSKLWWDSIGLVCGIIESWKMDLQNERMARQRPAQRGLIMSLFNFWWRWTFGWYSWAMNLAKGFVVEIYDYLSPILRQNQTFDKKVLHIYNDAKEQIPGGIKQSIAKGTHYAMSPMEYVASNLPQSNVKSEILNVLETIDPLSNKNAEIKLQQRRSANVGVGTAQSVAQR